MVSKLRAANRQEPEQNAPDDLAVFDLLGSALSGDPGLLGFAGVLLAGRNCTVSCDPSGRLQHRPRGNETSARSTNEF
jgi:hypothetical protein